MQITSGLPKPTLDSYMTLTNVIRDIHSSSPLVPPRHRLPITADIMRLLFNVWSNSPEAGCYVSILWAASCVGFFGFMWAGEFAGSLWRTFTADMLSPRDISVDSHEEPSVVSILLRRSKTDPFGVGKLTIHLGITHQDICPVSALLGYITRRRESFGPLFMFRDGTPLSKQRLMQQVKQDLRARTLVPWTSLGTATSVSIAEIKDSVIQTLGSWR